MTPAESMQSHLAELSKDFVKLVEDNAERHEETMRALAATNAGFAVLSRQVEEMIGLFRNYVNETATLRSEVREKLKVANVPR